jgi:hypothetical protein
MAAYWVSLKVADFWNLPNLTVVGSLLGSPQQGGGGLLGKPHSELASMFKV